MTDHRDLFVAYKQGHLSTQEMIAALRERKHRVTRHPLSQVQQGLWWMHQLPDVGARYHVPVCFRLQGGWNAHALKQATAWLLARHPVLKNVVRHEDGQPYQVESQTSEVPFFEEDASPLDDPGLAQRVQQLVDQPISLEHGPLLRVHLLQRGAAEQLLLFVAHHIVWDGRSTALLVSTFFPAYQELAAGRTPKHDTPEASYADFVAWEQRMLSSDEGQAHRDFWLQRLAGALPTLVLPSDHPRNTAHGRRADSVTVNLGLERTSAIQALCNAQGIRPSGFFLGIYQVLLHRLTGERDVIVGMPALTRPEPRFDHLMGYFVNMLPVRVHLDGSMRFVDLLKATQRGVLESLDHAAYPFPSIVRDLKQQRVEGQSSVFQVAYEYQSDSVTRRGASQEAAARGFQWLTEFLQKGEFELVLEVYERDGGYGLNLKYDRHLLEPATATRWLEACRDLIDAAVSDVQRRWTEFAASVSLDAASVVPPPHWNDTQVDYPRDICVHELFDQQAQRAPDRIALRFGDKALSYQRLRERSDRLAAVLRAQGVGQGTLVGLHMRRCADLVVAMLATLKSGAAYVPLDPRFPDDRLSYMIEDSAAAIVLTQTPLMRRAQALAEGRAALVDLDTDWESGTPAADLPGALGAQHLAYVIYTSGSTGRPKGVMIPHRALTNLVLAMTRVVGISEHDRVFAITTYSFDMSVPEFYLPLVNGGECVMCDEETPRDPKRLMAMLQATRPTVLQATPASWSLLFQAGWRNDQRLKILCGGEALPPALKQLMVDTGSAAWNLFGPTETTVWSTAAPIVAGQPITIGRPIANTQIHIVDEQLRPVPIGKPGELCIAGDGLALGYLNSPQLTTQKFVDNPFDAGTRLYRTGDMARWLPDGQIAYIGRIDTQIKLRGYRIELGEIESRLNEQAGVSAAAVVVHGEGDARQLVAYCIGDGVQEKALRDHLKSALPGYMIPARIEFRSELPLTPTGKIDRTALSAEDVKPLSKPMASRTPNHAQLLAQMLELWREVLNAPAIDADDGFLDAGGHSFVALPLAQRISTSFGCDFDVTDIFRCGSARGAVQLVVERGAEAEPGFADPANDAAAHGTLAGGDDGSLAIIGISCRFPGAKDHREFWENLREGRETIRFFDDEALRQQGVAEALRADENFVPAQASIEDGDCFDAEFFKMPPGQARLVDPQTRLLLQHAWTAIEDAGYRPRDVQSAGVFISTSNRRHGSAAGTDAANDEYLRWVHAQPGSAPTLIAFKLGLKGAAYALHANCSSSLVGLHAAQQAIRTGEMDVALVGAATLLPQRIGYLHQPGMNFSSSGHVKAFAEQADGMIGADGVAVLLVKKASKALADGDHVYALIRGVALNNDGADKAGYTAPSVRGQAEVIEKALRSAGVEPSSISYIEAHGTGTSLGDPIEVAGLREVYGRAGLGAYRCGLGSVKSNIGHTDTAAGLAGCIKLALSLRHEELVPSLHCERVNPALRLDDSPFYVVTQRQPWPRCDVPRRAALSSLGIGGTNAHLVMQESVRACAPERPVRPALIVLSAKNDERLKEQARQLAHGLDDGSDSTLADIAYTLQVGREPMQARLALVVATIEELQDKLQRFAEGHPVNGLCAGNLEHRGAALGVLESDEDLQQVVAAWIAKGRWNKLAELWVQGLDIDWERVPRTGVSHRVSLPTYPFAAERYPLEPAMPPSSDDGRVMQLHPLLHENTSDLAQQRYTSRFSGREFFLSDHRVQGRAVLPAVAQLEMVREAVRRAIGDTDKRCITIEHVVFASPVTVEEGGCTVHLALAPDGDDIAWQLQGETQDRVYSRGRATLHVPVETAPLDWQARQADAQVVPVQQCYEHFNQAQMHHGVAMRGLQQLWVGEDQTGSYALAKIERPKTAPADGFEIHPSMADAAFQASIGLECFKTPDATDSPLYLPFAIERVQCIRRLPASGWVLIRRTSSRSHLRKLDIQLFDMDGQRCLAIEGYAIRVVQETRADQDIPLEQEAVPSETAAAPVSASAAGGLLAQTTAFLKAVLSTVAGFDLAKIDEHAALEKYGIDSILVMRLTSELEQTFGGLSKTLFFEYQTLAELADHFVSDHQSRLESLFTVHAPPVQHSAPARPARFASSTTPAPAHAPFDDIAIIGVAGRYPKADDLKAFWHNLLQGVDCVSEIPSDRWDHSVYFDPRPQQQGKSYTKWGGFIDGFDCFDPLFFGISPREAVGMDPQERLFLQCAYATLEDAGHTRASISPEGRVGVFVGLMYEEYQLYGAQSQLREDGGFTLGGSAATVANRVSYWCDFHGPSVAVDTMCSGSLTAIHLACQALKLGQCDAAIAGGVNLSVHPNKFLLLSHGRFASSEGLCRSFGDGGDGYVPAEGVGAVLLKPLRRAIEDGDQIHGVIRATALNHGGKTNGYTVPNPKAQAQLIAQTLKDARVDARHISYVEAHGTGTSLGDPIEITGLSKAFSEHTQDRQYCAIGSVKSNIGHAEGAAGIAGLTKVLLQMRHRTLVKSLHSARLNPNIEFEKSPFVVQQATGVWKRPLLDGREVPRIAGLSSFGAGGSNAHVIVQEFDAAQRTHLPPGPFIIVLSAKNEDRLKEQAWRLKQAVQDGPLELCDVAYTLQMGREAMDWRWACVVHTLTELTHKLDAYLNAQAATALHHGEVSRDNVMPPLMPALHEAVGDPAELDRWAQAWVQGAVVDWTQLYSERPRPVSLPSYPFARERYWFTRPVVDHAQQAARLHPLLHENTSELGQQRYTSRFSGREFFLQDHRAQGHRVLPGVAQLEMVREAVRRALGAGKGESERACISIEHMVFANPVRVGESGCTLHVALQSKADAVDWQIYSEDESRPEPWVHSQGRATLGESNANAALNWQARQADAKPIAAEHCYAQYAQWGMHYGATLRGLEQLWIGQDEAGDYVLAKLQRPPAAPASGFQIHPSLADAALQAGIALAWHQERSALGTRLHLPFAIDRVQCLRELSTSGWALIRRTRSPANLSKLDVRLYDEQGQPCLLMDGYTSRALQDTARDARPVLNLWVPEWQDQARNEKPPMSAAARWVVLCDAGRDDAEELQQALGGSVQLHALRSDAQDLARRYTEMAVSLLNQIQAWVRSRPTEKLRVQLVAPARAEGQVMQGLVALLKSAARENPKLDWQLVAVEHDIDAQPLAQLLHDEAMQQDQELRYAPQRQVRQLQATTSTAVAAPWKRQGVYLVTGGAGGLGLLLAKEIATRGGAGVTLVLSGRSVLDASREKALMDLRNQGAVVDYHATDVGHRGQVKRLIAQIRERHGRLDGVVHAAGLLRDAFVLKKTPQQLQDVFAPKVQGLVNLDDATRELKLDFFVAYSSVSAVGGGVGQADYATANAFMDAFMAHRAERVRNGQRSGRSLSIDWPLWADGGMQMDEQAQQRAGMVPLSAEEGLRSLHVAMALDAAQVVVWPAPAAPAATQMHETSEEMPAPVIASDELQQATVSYLRHLIGTALMLDPKRIDPRASIENYGIDSVRAMSLTNDLEQAFGSLSKTLFFEHDTVEALARHFVRNHHDRLQAMLGMTRAEVPAAPALSPAAAHLPRRVAVPVPPLSLANDIAIIGLAGRYPQANDVQAYWRNLLQGVDCVSEIPAERWDASMYFDPRRGQKGKTYAKWGGFIDGVDRFDPLFFNITPRDAVGMDPQERLFLQCVYATLEDAGYTRHNVAEEGRTGVFVGVMYEEYQLYAAQSQLRQDGGYAVGGSAASVANRVSYWCDFQGPSLAIDTMCSSSLTAIHLACESLQRGHCDVAIAGGVNVSVHPNKFLLLAQSQFVSSDGRCRSFGEGGDGYVPAEGVGAVLLKPLQRAIEDGDQIYGVVKATAINHGGKTKGYTVPSPNAQGKVIARALAQAGIDARQVSYIEAHGTGTSLGDPIEIAGLSQAYSQDTQDLQFCAIGSAKSNIGHAESAAGIAGLTKVLLQMKHRTLVKNLHSETLNPNIDFAKTPFKVQQETAEWTRPVIAGREVPRIAGLSSFGAGGSNAHVIVQEYEAPLPEGAPDEHGVLILLSAPTDERLKERARQLQQCLQDRTHALADIAYTLQVGREPMDVRLALVVHSVAELNDKLSGYRENRSQSQVHVGQVYVGNAGRTGDVLAAFSTNDELREAVGKWMARGKWNQLAELWVQGLAVDWRQLYVGPRRAARRVSLPTYPFAGDRYWVSLTQPHQDAAPAAMSAQRRSMLLFKTWKPATLGDPPAYADPVVIFANHATADWAQALAARLPSSHILWEEHGPVSPAEAEASWLNLSAWVDLAASSDDSDRRLQWLTPLQRYVEHRARAGAVVLGVTLGLEAVNDATRNGHGGTRAALYRVLQSEHGALRSRHVDLDPRDPIDRRVEQILIELAAAAADEPQIAYRNHSRFAASLAESPASSDAGHEPPFAFRSDEVVWITGGTRGLGLLCAQHLVHQHGVRRLVLSGRTGFAPRAQWNALAQQDDEMSARVRALLALEKAGASVRISAPDLNDRLAVDHEVAQIREHLGRVGVLIHAAGRMDTQCPAFIRKSQTSVERVLEPKITGLVHLMEALHNEPLRLTALFSSVSAIVPALGAGQSDYAMANAYLDQMASRTAREGRIVSIQWSSWRDTGMGRAESRAMRERGLLAMSDAEGLALLDRVIAAPVQHAVLMPVVVDPMQWKPQTLLRRAALSDPPQAAHRATMPEVKASTATKAHAWLRELAAQQLGVPADQLDLDKSLADYGAESVLMLQLARAIAETVGDAQFDPSVLYEHGSLSAISQWLDAKYPRAASEPAPAERADAKRPFLQRPLQASEGADIAVVGMSCCFPGAPDLDAYWTLMREGRSALRRTGAERFGSSREYVAGLLDRIDGVNAGQFLISPDDARAMDPQALIMLDECRRMFAHAGYAPPDIKGHSIGVYIGARSHHVPDPQALSRAVNPILAVGQNYLAANISRFYDLHGPSLVIDTACSSALVAMGLAIQALHAGDVGAAVVGGVSLLSSDAALKLFERRGLLTQDPQFHLFDGRAQGTILSEGAGVVLIKRLSQAIEDGDRIYAVVKGLAVNNDGRTAGVAAPNPQALRDVMQAALLKSGKLPEDVEHVEVSGSGTELTDLLELKAIEAVYRSAHAQPCLLGSIKPNIGHPLCAEGIASFIKVSLMVHHGMRVPFLSAQQPMTHYDLAASPFRFSRAAEPWQGVPRVAAINCFADGGTNVHVIVQGWDGREDRDHRPHTAAPLAVSQHESLWG